MLCVTCIESIAIINVIARTAEDPTMAATGNDGRYWECWPLLGMMAATGNVGWNGHTYNLYNRYN